MTTLPELLDQRAAERPDAIALVGVTGSLTYAQLAARSNQLAHHLIALGLQREERVATCLGRGPDLVVAMLAVLKAGGAYVPIDSELPAERIDYMVSNAGARTAITQSDLRNYVSAERIVLVDEATGSTAPLAPPAMEQLAYVLYTSGSTGRPKGVQIQHDSLANFLVSMLDAPGITANATLLAITTSSFDISGLELFLPLLAGARVFIATRDQARDAVQLQQLLVESNATMMQATPATWQMLVESEWTGRPDLVALCGGEALPPALAAALIPRVSVLWNMYGPTETTIWSARKRITAGEPIRLGEPIAKTTLHVLDPASLAPRPAGVDGELFIGGDGLARGYVGRADLTAERFLADPFSTTPGARMYRTGDRVRRGADGELEFLGRVDHQVKIRGFRIELGEIEAVLRDHPNVSESVVVVRDDGGEARLVGYVVMRNQATTDDILATVRQRLPDYMVPAVVVLDAMPLSPAGKIDRKALPAPDRSAFVTSDYLAPRGPVEEALVAIWSELLNVPRVGVKDDFFALGGHSLLTIRLVAEIENRFRVRIPIREVLENATIEKLAIYIGANKGAPRTARMIYARSNATEARATSTQEYFWYLDRDDHDPSSYYVGRPRLLNGPLDVAAMAQSFRETAAAHSIYRTAYREQNGTLMQRVLADAPNELEIVDMSSVPEDQRTDAIKQAAAAQIARGYDLSAGEGILRGTLVRFSDDHHALIPVVHHIATDGASLPKLNAQLLDNYVRIVQGGAAPETGLQYIDFAHARARWATARAGQTNEAYWKYYVRGAPAVELEGDFPRAPIDAHRDAVPRGLTADLSHLPHLIELPADVYARVLEAARAQRTSPYVIFLSAIAWLLRERSGQDDLAVQTAYSPRAEDRLLESIHGAVSCWTITRMQLAGAARMSDAIDKVRTAVATVQDHGAPYDYYGIVPHRLRRVVFNYVAELGATSAPGPAPEYAGIRTSPFPPPPPIWKRTWDLHLTLNDSGSAAQLAWTGFSQLFERETLGALLARYVEILASVGDR
ncbi:MAG TPA: amino acid adenylation domain-containing protein [Kofleriaceae bacterium]